MAHKRFYNDQLHENDIKSLDGYAKIALYGHIKLGSTSEKQPKKKQMWKCQIKSKIRVSPEVMAHPPSRHSESHFLCAHRSTNCPKDATLPRQEAETKVVGGEGHSVL